VAEFACNSSVHRSTGLSSFEIVSGYNPRKPVDLLLPIGDRPNASIKLFAQHLHDLHDDIYQQITISNDYFKSATDLHK